jgi:glycosyltransferase involved in cell wall biosynthesis
MNILHIISNFNIYGGVPQKKLCFIKYSSNNNFLYVYEKSYNEFKNLFKDAGALVFEGYYNRNLILHLKMLLKIVDENNIQIVLAHFTMGEILGYLIKLCRPKIKLVVSFDGPFEPKGIKKLIAEKIYNRVDAFIFVSKYVKREKFVQFPIIKKKESFIIYNGAEQRYISKDVFPILKHISVYTTSGLVDCKNISILVEAINMLRKSGHNQIHLYIAGDGPERTNLENKIRKYDLLDQVILLGYQKNIGALLDQADIYVHPAYAEGFGISVVEAMMAGKPIIVANAGALPELIENGKSGLIVDPFDANAWADAILKLIDNKGLAYKLGHNAKIIAHSKFSIETYVSNYENLFSSILEKK